jgi:hypothetical protein
VDNLTPLVEKALVNHRVIKEPQILKKISTATKEVTPQKAALSPTISPTVEPLLKERNGHIRQDCQLLQLKLITGPGLGPDSVG